MLQCHHGISGHPGFRKSNTRNSNLAFTIELNSETMRRNEISVSIFNVLFENDLPKALFWGTVILMF